MYSGSYELIYINGSRRKVLVALVANRNTSYVVRSMYECKSSEVYVRTIESKGLGQRFEERRKGRPVDVLNIIKKRPNTVVPLKVDGAMEGRRSHKKMVSR